jgi:hypothetical protein
MNWIITIYIALLFFVLSPGVLVRLPPKGGKFTVAAVHALVFAVIWHFTGKMVWKASVSMGAGKTEGFREGAGGCKSKKGKDGTWSGTCLGNEPTDCDAKGYSCMVNGKPAAQGASGIWTKNA